MAGCRVQAAAVPGRTGPLGDGSHGAGPPFGFDCTYVMFKKAKTGRCSTFCTVGGIMHSINYCTVLYQ